MQKVISFIPLSHEHYPLLVQWLNEPHVRRWYNSGAKEIITLDAVKKKYDPRIAGIEKVQGYIIYIDSVAIGYIQMYDAREFPREGYDLSIINKQIERITRLGSLDLYIGNSSYVGKGYGSRIIKQFLHDIFLSHFDACLVDPDIHNVASIRSFEKAGFIPIAKVALTDGRSDMIMLYEKNK